MIKVLIVDDSRTAYKLLAHIIESDPELKVIAYAENGEEALKWLQNNSCDVITMDIHMPKLNGFEVTKRIMASKPIPTVIISSGYTPTDHALAFDAIEAGALAILEKPIGIGDANYTLKSESIINTIKMASSVKLVTHHPKQPPKAIKTPPPKVEIHAIAIGASLGGPLAIAQILEHLPASFPIPIFIVQHIAAGFATEFIRWLQKRSQLHVNGATHDTKAMPGCAYIALDACQMEIKRGDIITLIHTPHQQPSVGHLFKSMAETYGSHCAGVILTGMGRDGAAELLTMKQKGAYTIAQDKESCLMFGMPKEAIALGAATQIVPLNMIAPTLIALTSATEK